MAKIEDRQAGNPKGAYARVLGVADLGALISQVHATSISDGTELERLIYERCQKIDDLTQFINQELSRQHPDRLFVANKAQVKACPMFATQLEPDFVAFKYDTCYVIEVKDGDTFDTEKSPAIHDNLTKFMTEVSKASAFRFEFYLCGFNAETKEQIHHGTKRVFPLHQILTGRELCELFNIDFEEIRLVRTQDQLPNLEYFINRLLAIPAVRHMIIEKLKKLG